MMIIVFFGVLVIEIMLYILAGKKYIAFIEPLSKKEYPIKDLYPMALYLMDAVKYKYHTRYDHVLLMKVAEISGRKYARYYLKIHWANKITYLLLACLFFAMVGLSMDEPDMAFGIFSILIMCALFFVTDKELDQKIKRRRLLIQLEFPEFINKFTLLINAGMTVSRAWEKTVKHQKKESPLYHELMLAIGDINAGKSETQAYEDFAKRCRVPEITKFISVIVQNLRKGGTEIVSVLRMQSNECWHMRINTAKRLGEEASTKMLLPMMIMFLAILLIVATPALLSMRNI